EATGRKSFPWEVSSTKRVERCSRGTRTSASRSLMATVSADWDTFSLAAARVKLSSSATVTKPRNCLMVKFLIVLKIRIINSNIELEKNIIPRYAFTKRRFFNNQSTRRQHEDAHDTIPDGCAIRTHRSPAPDLCPGLPQ